MKLPAEIIEKLLKACDNDSRKVADEFARIHDINAAVNICGWHTSEAIKEFNKKKKEIEARLTEIQSACKHWWTRHQGDAGLNDTSTVCEICGKYL